MPSSLENLSIAGLSPSLSLLALGLAALLLIGLLLLLLRRGSRPPSEWQIRRAVGRLGVQTRKNLLIHDGIDGHFQVDYAVLSAEGIYLVQVRRYEGRIYGGQHIDEWTQVLPGGSYRFPNPIHQLQLVIATLKARLPKIPVKGIVLFAGNCEFPKDKPKGTLLLSDLPGRRKPQQVSEQWQQAWQALLAESAGH